MADSTVEKPLKLHGPFASVSVGVAASTKVLAGTLVAPDAGGDLTQGGDDAGAGRAFLCLETVDNTAGADGDLKAKILVSGMFSGIAVGTLTKADIGDNAMAVDNQTISNAATTTNDIPVGLIVGWDDESNTPILKA